MHPTAGGIAVRLVSNYYQIILDIGLFLFFVIGAKVMVLFTIRVSRPRVLRSRRILWTAFGAWWLASGILQIFPWTVTYSLPTLTRTLYRHEPHWLVAWYHPMLALLTARPITWNILVVIFQFLIGIMLLTERENIAGRITLLMATVFAWLVWVIPQAFGFIFSGQPSVVKGSPGAGLIAGLIGILLLLPAQSWRSHNVPVRLRQGLAVFFALACLLQINPWSGFWSSRLIQIFAHSPVPAVKTLISLMAEFAVNYPVILNGLIVIALFLMAVLLSRNQFPTILLLLSALFLLWSWASGQGFGLIPAIGANANTAPLLFLLILISTGDTSRMTKESNHPS